VRFKLSLRIKDIFLAGRGSRFYVADMNLVGRAVLLLLSGLLISRQNANGQGLQVDVEEFKRLAGEVADLRDANSAQQKRIAQLQREVEALRTALRENSERSTMKQAEFATRDELKKLVDKIQEVDQKREADRKLILEEFEKLGKTLTQIPPNRTRKEPTTPPPTSTEPIEGTFLPYKVQEGDGSLSEIIAKFNAEMEKQGRRKITISQVQRANPKININRIYTGQEIQLPVPDKK
jgi:hypothetical protein